MNVYIFCMRTSCGCNWQKNCQMFYRAARFNSVHHLSILFPTNFGAETTKVYYIGLRGDFMEVSTYVSISVFWWWCFYCCKFNSFNSLLYVLSSIPRNFIWRGQDLSTETPLQIPGYAYAVSGVWLISFYNWPTVLRQVGTTQVGFFGSYPCKKPTGF